MANKNSPSGLQSVDFAYANKPGVSTRVYRVPANQTNALYVGDPVVKVAGSGLGGFNGVDLATAGSNAAITGVINGFVGVAPANSTTVTPSLFGFSGQPGNTYRPASTTQDYYVLVNDSSDTLYSVQVGNAVLSQADIGKNFNLVSGAGSAYTGLSGWLINSTAIADGAGIGQVNVIGFDSVPQNNSAQAYARVLVRLNSSTETNGSQGI